MYISILEFFIEVSKSETFFSVNTYILEYTLFHRRRKLPKIMKTEKIECKI